MVRTGRWRVLLAATLLGVAPLLAPMAAGAQDGGTDGGASTTSTVPSTDPSTSTSTTSTTVAPTTSTSTPEPTTTTSTTTATTVPPPPPAVPNPVVSGPVKASAGTHGHPVTAATEDLAALGYVEQELLVSGTGTVHSQAGTWGADGRWSTADVSQLPYRTRILVRRPADPARFSGTVVVSWLNVGAAFENDPEWAQLGDELAREGAVWVGVSTQMLGVEGPLGAKAWDKARYGSLDLRADSLSYDVYSQVAQAIRSPKGVDPLAGLGRDRRLVGVGQAQSAQRLLTYINAFQPVAKAYDGFLLISRFRGAAPLGRTLLPAQGVLDPDGTDPDHPFLPDPLTSLLSGPAEARVRADTTVPVFTVLTETEARQDAPVRVPDSSRSRTWEVAGASHVDTAATAATVADLRRDFPKVPLGQLLDCAQPNAFPTRYALRAAVRGLAAWVATGTPPATAPPLTRDKAGALVRDADGNVKGGLRLPQIDVPTARYSGESTADGYCGLTGSTVPFTAASLAKRYPTTQAYADAIGAAAQAAVTAGHLLPEDATDIVAAAQGGAVQAAIAQTAAVAEVTSTTAGAAAPSASPGGTGGSGQSAAPAAGEGIDAAAASSTRADHGWLATTGKRLFTPLLIALLLVLNARVVLTVAHERRHGSGGLPEGLRGDATAGGSGRPRAPWPPRWRRRP